MATTKMIAGLMGPTLLAIGIAMLVNARHFPEMAKQIGNDPGLIFVSGILLLGWLGNRARAQRMERRLARRGDDSGVARRD
jgi:hypothetical protein